MWKTRGARFSAYQRLRKTQQLSFYSTSFLSAYLIVINLLPAFKLLPDFISVDHISFLSAALSIVLLIYTVIESSMNYGLNADRFHNCARELSSLHAQLYQLLDRKKSTEQNLKKISDEYNIILNRYENHDPLDYNFHKATNPKEFKLNCIEANWIKFRWNYLIHSRHYFVLFVFPIFLLIFFLINHK